MRKQHINDSFWSDVSSGNVFIEVIKKGKKYRVHYDKMTPSLQSSLHYGLYRHNLTYEGKFPNEKIFIEA